MSTDTRIESVDFFRVLAIVGVIAIHTGPFRSTLFDPNQLNSISYFLINQTARFAVPLFFIISGFFWSLKLVRSESVSAVSKPALKRVLTIFVVWTVIYLLPINLGYIADYGFLGPLKLAYWDLLRFIRHPLDLLMEGGKPHLWFLMSLLFAMTICSVFVSLQADKALISCAIGLFVLGVLAKAYIDSPIGLPIDFDTRHGPFFSTLFFISGYYIGRFNPKACWLFYGLFLFFLGAAMHVFEVYWLWRQYGTSPYQDYVFGTYFMGLGAALMALSNSALFRVSGITKMGKYVLGIYVSHWFFVSLLRPIDRIVETAWWDLGYILIVFLLSLGLTVLMSRNRVTRSWVM